MEAFARQRMQQLRQRMLEEAVDGVLGRGRSQRDDHAPAPAIESPFAAVRLQTAAEKTFRRLDAPEVLADVAGGVAYVNGVRAVNRRDDKSPPDLIYTLLAKTSLFLHQCLPALPRDTIMSRRATYRIRRGR